MSQKPRDWYEDHENLATLWDYLEEQGQAPHNEVAYFLEKPWKWEPEWNELQTQLANEIASEQLLRSATR